MTSTTDRGPDTDSSRALPHDLFAEQSVLGAMLQDPDVIDAVTEVLDSSDFYQPRHSFVFDTIVTLASGGQERPDPSTVATALTDRGLLNKVGGLPYLFELLEAVPVVENATYYARTVKDRAVLRRLTEVGARISQLGYGTTKDLTDAADRVDQAQQLVYDLTEGDANPDGFSPLAHLLQPALDDIEAAARGDGMGGGVPTGFADLDRLLAGGLKTAQLVVVAGRPGQGKALALDTPLPTPDGWTTMGEVRVGDLLLDANGCPTAVTALSDIMTGRRCFEVEFSDGSVIVADGSHRWLTHTRHTRRYGKAPQVHTTDEIAATLRTKTADQRLNHSVEVAKALALPERELPVAPYTLGVWLGDGHSAAARFTTADPEIVAYIEADGYMVSKNGHMAYAIRVLPLPPLEDRVCAICGKVFTPRSPSARTCGRSCGSGSYHKLGPMPEHHCESCGEIVPGRSVPTRRCASCTARYGSVAGMLRELGVLGDKHIPQTYLRASEPQRRALLAGLLDTDGTVEPSGNICFSVTSQRLAYDVHELIVSLGYRCSMTTKRVRGRSESTSTAYIIKFSTADDLFRLERKRIAHKERCRTANRSRISQRYITDVRPVASVPVRCVSVDNADHLYLAGRSMIPTHNSTLGMDIARCAAIKHNMPVAFFSLEMDKSELVLRILSAEARIDLNKLRAGQLNDDDWTKLARRMGEIAEAPLLVDDGLNNLMQIRAKARKLKRQHDIKLIVVDYLQIMPAVLKLSNRQEEVAEMSRGLKLLAKETGCPVIALSQLNRGPEQRADKRPGLADMRESGAIEQDADIVILVHRDDYYDKESPRAGEADLMVVKHRNGPTDTVTVASQLHLARFVDMAI